MSDEKEDALREEEPTPAMRLAQRVEAMGWRLCALALLGGVAEQLVIKGLPAEEAELPSWLGWSLWAIVAVVSVLLIYVLAVYAIPEYVAALRG